MPTLRTESPWITRCAELCDIPLLPILFDSPSGLGEGETGDRSSGGGTPRSRLRISAVPGWAPWSVVMSEDYRVNGRTDQQVRGIANRVKRAFKVDRLRPVNIVRCLESGWIE